MRLGTCVALELIVGSGLAVALCASTAWGLGELRDRLSGEAFALTLTRGSTAATPREALTVISPLEPGDELERSDRVLSLFDGVDDELLLAPLRDAPITRAKFNRGGSSISLRLDFANGARAAFKPRQTNLQTIPRREVAAYRVNRLVGLGSVAPACGRKFKQEDLLAALDGNSRGYAPRIRAETVVDGEGYVVGELSWWIPVIAQAKVGGFRIDTTDGIVTWKRLLTPGVRIPGRDLNMVMQVSNMVLFDHFINNSDRWTGGNARVSPDRRLLYYMDNTLSFGISKDGHERTRIYLRRVQRFSRSLVHRLRNLTREEIVAVLREDTGPFEVLLKEAEVDSLLDRRDYSMAYIDELIDMHGADKVLVFP
jgi:hypothetical protein